MSSAVEGALKTLFTGDTTLMGIVTAAYNVVAPQGAAYPHVIYHKLVGPDEYTLTERVRTQYSYQIRVIDKSESMAKINAAMERIEVLLMDKELVAGQTLYCRRSGAVPNYPEKDADGAILLQGGATYSIQVR